MPRELPLESQWAAAAAAAAAGAGGAPGAAGAPGATGAPAAGLGCGPKAMTRRSFSSSLVAELHACDMMVSSPVQTEDAS